MLSREARALIRLIRAGHRCNRIGRHHAADANLAAAWKLAQQISGRGLKVSTLYPKTDRLEVRHGRD